jgi:AcrR family transcriptional regulator
MKVSLPIRENPQMVLTGVPRRTNAERSRHTRLRIMQAAIDCLIEDGYAAASIGEIQDRAGVSRGALLHQYPSKTTLLIDAIRHLSDRQFEQFKRRLAAKGGNPDWLAILWQSFDTPEIGALLELWVAARTDATLRDTLLAQQRELRCQIRSFSLAHFGDRLPGNFDAFVDSTLIYYRGLALTNVLTKKRSAHALADWRRIARTTLSEDFDQSG